MRFIEFTQTECGQGSYSINPAMIHMLREVDEKDEGVTTTIYMTSSVMLRVNLSKREVLRRIQVAEDLRRQDEAK